MNNIIQPVSLDTIQLENNCMFCIKPEGHTYVNCVDTDTNLGFYNCGLCTLAVEKAIDLWHDINNFIYPQTLTFVRVVNNCMFCKYPIGQAYGRFVDDEAKYGYTYCNKCESSVDRTMELWNTYFAYGRAKYLHDKEIKIKRSSGEIESGWKLYNPIIGYDNYGNELIHCINYRHNLTKWCLIDDIIKMNPECGYKKSVYNNGRLSPIFE